MSLSISFCSETSPVNDFYRYVNEKWMKENPIPDDFQRWSIFNKLNEDNRNKVQELLNNLSYSNNSEFNSLKVLYDQGLNLEEINLSSPHDYLKNYLNQLEQVNSKEELLNKVFKLHVLHGMNTPYQLSVYSDFDNSNWNILHIFTAGLGLPDRDYYFDTDKEEIRGKYKEYMRNYSELFKMKMDVEEIYNLEKTLAEVSYTRVERRDPHKLNNPSDYQKIVSKYSSLPIKHLFEYLKNKEPSKINISNPKFLDKYEELWKKVDLKVWISYYQWRFINEISAYINEQATNVRFDFFGKTLTGTPELLPRWKRVISNCDSKLGVVVGKLFTKKYFPESAKKKALKMVNYIKDELEVRLNSNDWMEPETKKKAVEKLSMMKVKIGYPDKPKDYSKLILSLKDNYFDNNLKCLKFNEDLSWDKLYREKDLGEWFMHPHMVNAYFSPTYNEIVFPAGILQNPFFDENFDAALNFGGIGSVIGHEITHGFDDQGRKFDSKGNLNDWWTDKDAEKYVNKTSKLRDQYSNYVIEGKNLNGELTLGENIADLGGVSISYHSMSKYLKDNMNESKVLEGFTPQQRFFLNYAKIWRCNTRSKEILNRLVTDPHSPPEFRVNGVLTNLVEFYQAFGVKESDKLWKPEKERISIW